MNTFAFYLRESKELIDLYSIQFLRWLFELRLWKSNAIGLKSLRIGYRSVDNLIYFQWYAHWIFPEEIFHIYWLCKFYVDIDTKTFKIACQIISGQITFFYRSAKDDDRRAMISLLIDNFFKIKYYYEFVKFFVLYQSLLNVSYCFIIKKYIINNLE